MNKWVVYTLTGETKSVIMSEYMTQWVTELKYKGMYWSASE